VVLMHIRVVVYSTSELEGWYFWRICAGRYGSDSSVCNITGRSANDSGVLLSPKVCNEPPINGRFTIRQLMTNGTFNVPSVIGKSKIQIMI